MSSGYKNHMKETLKKEALISKQLYVKRGKDEWTFIFVFLYILFILYIFHVKM